MPIKDILVLADAGEANDFRVETAFLLAKIYHAHVTGIHLVPYPTIPMYGGFYPEIGPYSAAMQSDKSNEIDKNLESSFIDIARKLHMPYEWDSVEGVDLNYLIEKARYTDIVVVPQGYSRYGESEPQNFNDYLVVHAGRPLLVVPDLRKIFNLPNRVVIAWNESHEAARAVHDAIPILQYAEHVQIVSVSNSSDQEKASVIYCDDLRKHLAHHGITVDSVSLEASISGTGQAILENSIEYDADLIVMGGYGHSRLRQIILGGVTKYLLNHTTIPILLSR